MKYTIWRVGPYSEEIEITASGVSSVVETAFDKANALNERLHVSEPDCEDRYVVRDSNGMEIKPKKVVS